MHILRLLSVRDACVCELVELLPISQSAVSQHLRKLKYAGFVRDYREKSWIFYALRADIAPALTQVLQELPIRDAEADWLRSHQVGSACPVPVADPADDAVDVSDSGRS